VRVKEECCAGCDFVLASAELAVDDVQNSEGREGRAYCLASHCCCLLVLALVDRLEEALVSCLAAVSEAVQIHDLTKHSEHCLAVAVAASDCGTSQTVLDWIVMADLEEVEKLLARWVVNDGSVFVLHWVEDV